MSKRLLLNFPFAVLAGLLFGLTACNQAGDSAPGEAIRVGEYASLTGKEAAFGQSSHKGTLLAIDEINAAGGVLGKPLRLISEDNQTKAGESATIVKKLITRDRVVAVLGEVATGRFAGGGAYLPDEQSADDLAILDKSTGDGDGRLHFPCLLHRPIPRQAPGRFCPPLS